MSYLPMSWLAAAGVIIVFFIGKKAIRRYVTKIGDEKEIAQARIQYVANSLVLGWTFLAFIALAFALNIGFQDAGIFFGSVFAVIGVALFAQWSVLSNLTSSIIIFFFFPYRVGDRIRLLDKDDSFEGEIEEIQLFHVIVRTPENDIVTYPNAMVFQKAVKIFRSDNAQTKTAID